MTVNWSDYIKNKMLIILSKLSSSTFVGFGWASCMTKPLGLLIRILCFDDNLQEHVSRCQFKGKVHVLPLKVNYLSSQGNTERYFEKI